MCCRYLLKNLNSYYVFLFWSYIKKLEIHFNLTVYEEKMNLKSSKTNNVQLIEMDSNITTNVF